MLVARKQIIRLCALDLDLYRVEISKPLLIPPDVLYIPGSPTLLHVHTMITILL